MFRSRSSQRNATPTSPEEDSSPQPIPDSTTREGSQRRRPSFSFLHRTKSRERLSSPRSLSSRSPPPRSPSTGKLKKKQRDLLISQELMREEANRQPPMIPNLPRPTQLQTFGGEESTGHYQRRAESGSNLYNIPIPPIPGNVDPYARTESMTHRGRYSYASSTVSTVNSPRRVRRRRDPTPFNILIVGARNSGKTSFLNFLRDSLALPLRKQRSYLQEEKYNGQASPSAREFPNFTSHYLETEIESERIGLTMWDSTGLEAHVVDLQLRDMSTFLESKFEDTFNEEMKIFRSPGVRDTHIHCVFFLLDPSRIDSNIASSRRNTPKKVNHTNGDPFSTPSLSSPIGGLDESFELQVLRTLQGKTTVIPVISKADTITSAHMAHLKRAIWDSIKKSALDPLEGLKLDDTERFNDFKVKEYDETPIQNREGRRRSDSSQFDSPTETTASFSTSDLDLSKPSTEDNGSAAAAAASDTPYLPFSIISPDIYEPDVAGRRFPWGFADPYNAEHCDFSRLKETCLAEWRGELREASRNLYYEGWRTSRLNRQPDRGRR